MFERDRGISPETLHAYEQLIKDAAWIEKVMRTEEENSFPHGDFTVMSMQGVPRTALNDCLATLNQAAKLLRPRFPQVSTARSTLRNQLVHLRHTSLPMTPST